MDLSSVTTPWVALIFWVFLAAICGVLLVIRLSPQSYSRDRRKRLILLSVWGIGALFLFVLIQIFLQTGSWTVMTGFVMLFSVLWFGTWWIYKIVFRSVAFEGLK